MKAKVPGSKQHQLRTRIAQLAARIMAEEGAQDMGYAKRKAARQMGCGDAINLPNNSEVEQELRTYQSIYQQGEQRDRLRYLRAEALRIMRIFKGFDPHLTGPVLSGTATRYADITIHLFADDAKAVEFFLIGQAIPYRSGEKRIRCQEGYRSLPTFTLTADLAVVELVVMSPNELRISMRNPPGGKCVERARPERVASLLEHMESSGDMNADP